MPPLLKSLLALMLVIVTATLPTQADDVTYSGIAQFPERVRLPAQSELVVSLIALPQGNTVASARAALDPGATSPIQFTLDVRSVVLARGDRFGLVAAITAGGVTFYHAPQPQPVASTSTDTIVLSLQTAPRMAPAPAPDETTIAEIPSPLFDLLWTVTSIAGRPVPGDQPLTLSIAADHGVGGFAGCNNYFAEASIDGQSLVFGPAAATRMACAPALMQQEADFLAALAAVHGFEIEGNGLRLLDAAGIPLVGLVTGVE
jgi:putative lipoprotein